MTYTSPKTRDEAAARAAGRGAPARELAPTWADPPGARRVQGEARGVWAGGELVMVCCYLFQFIYLFIYLFPPPS